MMDWQAFLRNTTGSIAVSFALASTALAVAAGCAVDYARWAKVQTELQALADAAALSAGASGATTTSTLKSTASKFIAANAESLAVSNLELGRFVYDSTSKQISIDLNADVPMAFMSLVGIEIMEARATATIKSRNTPPIEAVLVLDTTYSMNGSKIDTLKTAAKNLIRSILVNSDARVGVVPFGTYVNVGVSRRGETGLSVPADSSWTTESCSTSYPNATNCQTTSTPSTCTSTNDGITTTYSCTRSSTTCASWGEPVRSCWPSTATSKFYGCVGSRAEAYRPVTTAVENTYPGLMNTSCAKEILDLTSNLSAAVNKIDSLTVGGETYLPSGITWGWNMLTEDAPLTAAQSQALIKSKGGKKVLVIMTDGTNTMAPTSINAGPHGSSSSGPYRNTPYANTLTAELCHNIKSDDIDVYTVLFDVTDATVETLLRDCASTPSKSYVANDARELIAAFDSIAKQLAQVRIVK